VTPSAGWRIARYGGGIDEVALDELRERIRRGEVVGSMEISPPGTNQWVRVAEVPELAAWLRVSRESPAVLKAAVASSPVESVGSRAISGVLYPLSSGGGLILVALSILSLVPLLNYAVGPATAIWILAIIRKSARGERSMPSDVSSDLGELVETGFKMTLVSLVTLLPVIGLLAWGLLSQGPGILRSSTFQLALGASILCSLLYYPASLATVAVWEHALPALSPAHVVRVIRTMKADYVVAVAMGTAGVSASVVLARLTSSALDDLPLVGSIPALVIKTCAAFWAAHVLGWAVHRHAKELGWN
jgi:hypothetical protein